MPVKLSTTNLYNLKLFGLSLIYFLLSLLVNTSGVVAPVFFLFVIYTCVETQKNIPWYFLLFFGALYDDLYYCFFGINIFLFLFMYIFFSYIQKFIFEYSLFRHWIGFAWFCILAFAAQSMLLLIQGYEFNLHFFINYLFLFLLYPILKNLGNLSKERF